MLNLWVLAMYTVVREISMSVMFRWNVKKTLTQVTGNICSVRSQVVMKGDYKTQLDNPQTQVPDIGEVLF